MSDDGTLTPAQVAEFAGTYYPWAKPKTPRPATRADVYLALLADEEVTLDYRFHVLTITGEADYRTLTIDESEDLEGIGSAWERAAAIRDLDYLIDILDEVTG